MIAAKLVFKQSSFVFFLTACSWGEKNKEEMDVKRSHGARQTSSSSSGESSCDSPGSPSRSPAQFGSQASASNVFANDGSFMELFKKKMEEEKRKKEAQLAGAGDAGPNEQGQTSLEKKPPPVTTFVRGLSSCKMRRR